MREAAEGRRLLEQQHAMAETGEDGGLRQAAYAGPMTMASNPFAERLAARGQRVPGFPARLSGYLSGAEVAPVLPRPGG